MRSTKFFRGLQNPTRQPEVLLILQNAVASVQMSSSVSRLRRFLGDFGVGKGYVKLRLRVLPSHAGNRALSSGSHVSSSTTAHSCSQRHARGIRVAESFHRRKEEASIGDKHSSQGHGPPTCPWVTLTSCTVQGHYQEIDCGLLTARERRRQQ